MNYTETVKYRDWYYNTWLKYYNWFLQCNIIVNSYNSELNRRKRSVAVAAILYYANKRPYKNKKFWVAPIFKIRDSKGFFNAVFPTLHLEDLRFHNYLRMSASQLETFLQLVGHDIYKKCVVREPIATAQRLVLTLRFLASGDSITSMSFQYLVGVTTANKIISQVCKTIWKNVWPIVLPSNFSEEKWLKISDEFENKWHFPHCIGAIDGKHIIIQCPRKAGSSYYNYKGSHSVVLLAICTGSYIFSFVDIGSYGRQSDAGIYKESQISKLFESSKINLPPACSVSDDGPILPFCIVGDEAFPLKSYLLRPYPGKSVTTQEKQVFNFRLSRARRTIENTFGILASRWRIFRKPILSNPEHVIQFTQATICLHNWLRIEDMENEDLKTPYITPEMVDRDDADNGLIPGLWRNDVNNAFQETSRTGNNAGTREAFEIREKFCNYLNNEGSLGCQYDYL